MKTLVDGASEPRVRIRDLNHYFGTGEVKKQVLMEANLDVMPGDVVIMTGPSGSGKTTLLTLVGALRSAQEGQLKVMGRELLNLDPDSLSRVRREIGFIFQAHNLFDSLTAFENVCLAVELHDCSVADKEAKVIDILTKLGLGHRIHYKPSALSGGQRQRVAVARALVNRPKLILADEPTAALDKESGRDVVNLFRGLADEDGCTVLVVTHDSRILDTADRIVNLVDGRIIGNVMVKESITVCEFLKRCPVFSALDTQALTDVANKMVAETVPAKKVVIQQGMEGDKFYLIRRGGVAVVSGPATAPVERAKLTEGDFFGEASLLTSNPRSATVVTTQETELYSLRKEHFREALEQSPSFAEVVRRTYFQRHS